MGIYNDILHFCSFFTLTENTGTCISALKQGLHTKPAIGKLYSRGTVLSRDQWACKVIIIYFVGVSSLSIIIEYFAVPLKYNKNWRFKGP